MNRLSFTPFIFALAVMFASTSAMASQQGVVAIKNWTIMDKCARDAQAAFPDFTADSNAKRDAKERECLESKNMPPREPLVPGR